MNRLGEFLITLSLVYLNEPKGCKTNQPSPGCSCGVYLQLPVYELSARSPWDRFCRVPVFFLLPLRSLTWLPPAAWKNNMLGTAARM